MLRSAPPISAFIQSIHMLRSQPDWWAHLCAGYLASLVRRGRRPNTRIAYSFELRDFGFWLQHADIGSLTELTATHIEAWQDDQEGRKAPRTRQVAAAALRGALRWATDQGLPLSSPTLWLRIVRCRAPRLKPRPIPPADLRLIQLYLESPERRSLLDLRNRALFWLIYSSGARISEALSLLRDSITDDGAVVVQKGGSEHFIVISPKASQAIRDYLNVRQDGSPMLFLAGSGQRVLEHQEVQRVWDRLCRQVGIVRFTSHQIRHSCATELLRQHIDSLVIARHLGHRGLGSIAGYAEVALDSRRAAMQALDG